jgi:PhnB protein
MLKANIYLSFDGTCADAFRLYEKCLGGKIVFSQTYGESPMAAEAPPEWQNRIMHTSLSLGDGLLQGADSPPGQYRKPQGFTVALAMNDAAEAERVFEGLSEGGAVQMPLQETYWALRFGAVVDRFGTPWMINCDKPA